MAQKGDAPLKGITDLQTLLKQRTWDKDVLLWLGSERSLLDVLGSTSRVILDLLDLFDLDNLPVDDDETRRDLTERLRDRLKSIPKGPTNRTVLVVKSIGLLARYRIGIKEFYDWFVGSHTVVALVLEGLPKQTNWPEELRCDAKRLSEYFGEAGMVKDVYVANG
jgi:broad specificity phosphatase PhoE